MLSDRPAFPFYTTSTVEAAYTQWPLCQRYLSTSDLPPLVLKPQPPQIASTLAFYASQLGTYRWLSDRPPSPDELELRYSVVTRLDRLPMIRSVAALEQLVKDLYTLGTMVDRRTGISRFVGPPRYAADIEDVEARIEELLPAAFLKSVEPPIEPEILGYTLPEWATRFAMGHSLYRQFHEAWHREDQLSREELLEWLEDNCCSDWSRMDVQGESYGGFWRYPEDSPEYANAGDLSRATNLQALCSLPYPARAIMLAVDVGCGNRQESVPYTVLCCEWFQRKLAQMQDFPFVTYMVDEEDEMRP